MTLTEEVYKRTDGQNYVSSPPIRSKEVQERLWKLLEVGFIDVVNSDHSDFNLAQKAKYKNEFTKIPNGLPGIEREELSYTQK